MKTRAFATLMQQQMNYLKPQIKVKMDSMQDYETYFETLKQNWTQETP